MFNGNYFPAAYFPEGWGDHEGGSPVANISCTINCVSSFVGGLIAEAITPPQAGSGGGLGAYRKAKKKRLEREAQIYASWSQPDDHKPQPQEIRVVVTPFANKILANTATGVFLGLQKPILLPVIPTVSDSALVAPLVALKPKFAKKAAPESKHKVFSAPEILAEKHDEPEWDYDELVMMVEYLEAV